MSEAERVLGESSRKEGIPSVGDVIPARACLCCSRARGALELRAPPGGTIDGFVGGRGRRREGGTGGGAAGAAGARHPRGIAAGVQCKEEELARGAQLRTEDVVVCLHELLPGGHRHGGWFRSGNERG
ncbi:hypothetical protein M6B38_346045 [Iris pallida]|uniref:Uncharacterized protein n=1 Tax=Iris pallida TaxID=29817 RepID=A0AAX6GUL2_IRIPA|nr:hypothetical protein M6B38_357620 [Iris pallida]KAJ6831961.1 hypothetical protein M6B38_346045 [Iris pallida]